MAGTLKEITEAIQACVDASIEFESAVTGVYKTVEGTPEQLQEISNGIKESLPSCPRPQLRSQRWQRRQGSWALRPMMS